MKVGRLQTAREIDQNKVALPLANAGGAWKVQLVAERRDGHEVVQVADSEVVWIADHFDRASDPILFYST